MKSALARVRLELSADGLRVIGRLSGVVHLGVGRRGLVSCELWGDSQPLARVRFSDADWSHLARLLVSGAPAGARDQIVLNVSSPSTWKQEIDRLIEAR